MPSRPPKVSAAPRITRKPWQRGAKKDHRKRGRAGVEERHRIRDEEPLCRACLEAGRVEPTKEIDHIVPLAEGGSDDRSNKQGLCDACHRAKSAAEAAAARARARHQG